MTNGPDAGGERRTWTAAILAAGGILVVAGIVVGGILGFAAGAAIGAAVTETAAECQFEECVDPGILPGAVVGLVVGAILGGLAVAALWIHRVRRSRRVVPEPGGSDGEDVEPEPVSGGDVTQ